MRRREFITLIGGATAWPIAVRAQQSALPVVGFLNSRSPGEAATDTAGFRQGLAEAGYLENQNVAIEYRWAEGRYERLPALAADLVERRVAVIAALGGSVSALAVKAVTKTVPLVFISGVDPVKLGLVASFAKPGGNATGVNVLMPAIESKRLGLLREMVPAAAAIAYIVNPTFPEADTEVTDVQGAARSIGCALQILQAGTESEINLAFETIAQLKPNGLLVGADPFFLSQRERIVALAARQMVPAIYEARTYAAAGGLMSYGPDLADVYRQVGVYTGRILKGAKPADLPVIQPTSFELVINLKTAKALGLTVPANVARTSRRSDRIARQLS